MRFIYLFIVMLISCKGQESKSFKATLGEVVLKGYFDDNTTLDIITKEFSNDQYIFRIYLVGDDNSNNLSNEIVVNEEYSDLLYENVHNIEIFKTENNGEFGITASCCNGSKEYETNIYKYENKKWDIIRSYTYSYRPNPYFSMSGTKSYNYIDYKVIESEMREEIQSGKKVSENHDLIHLGQFLYSNSLDESNLENINNMAYYLEQSGAYSESVYLLSEIVDKFPNRVVAYFNLGDAYWGLSNFEKAKEAYIKYVELMKAQGKDLAKIPQRVYDRTK